jgi:hypothetical protein
LGETYLCLCHYIFIFHLCYVSSGHVLADMMKFLYLILYLYGLRDLCNKEYLYFMILHVLQFACVFCYYFYHDIGLQHAFKIDVCLQAKQASIGYGVCLPSGRL